MEFAAEGLQIGVYPIHNLREFALDVRRVLGVEADVIGSEMTVITA